MVRFRLLALLGLFLVGQNAHAAVFTGQSGSHYDDNGVCVGGGANNSFDDPKNWAPPCGSGSVPTGTADLNGFGVDGTSVNVGTLITHGGSLTASSISVGNLQINGGGVYGKDAASSTLVVSSSVSWTQGTISTLKATFAPTCTATVSHDYDNAGSGSYFKNITQGTLRNRGTLNWSGSPFSGGGTLNNEGTFNLLGDGEITWPNYASGINIVNSGKMLKTGGNGTTTISVGGAFTNNGGTLSAKTGIFDTSSISGNGNGPTKLNGGTIGVGEGQVQISGECQVNGAMTVNGTLRLEGAGISGKATLSGPGVLDWKSGGFSGDANTTKIVLASDFHTQMSGDATKGTGILVNKGIINWTGGQISGTLTNQGTFNFLNDGDLGDFPNGANTGFINSGTIAKTGGTGTLNVGLHTLDNSGVIDVQSGIMVLGSTPNGGNDFYRDGSKIKGAGKLVTYYPAICSGTITINGLLELHTDTSGPNTFTGIGKLLWMSGTMHGVTLAQGFTTNASGDGGKGFYPSDTTQCTNAGTLNWKGGAAIGFGGAVTNSGIYNVLAAGYFGGGTFNNSGVLNTFGSTTNQLNGTLNNSGTLNLGNANAPGILALYGGDNNQFNNSGTVNAFLAGTADGQFSQLQGLSDANGATQLHLGGTLNVHLKEGFTPGANAQFAIVKVFPDRASYTGTFATVTGTDLSNGRHLKMFYNSGIATLGTALTIAGKAFRWISTDGVLTKQGINGVAITLSGDGTPSQTVTTGADGNFSFVVGKGTYSVSALKLTDNSDSYNTFDPRTQTVSVPTSGVEGVSPDAKVQFVTYSIKVKVVNGVGEPVVGLGISARGIANNNYLNPMYATTDANGIATYNNLGPAEYTVSPGQTGYVFTPSNKVITLPTSGIDGTSPNGKATFTRTKNAPSGKSGRSG